MLNMLVLRLTALCLIACSLLIGATRGWEAGTTLFVAGGLAIELLKQPARLTPYLRVYTGVTLADIFIPKVYGTIQPNDSPETTAFAQSGVAVTNPLLTQAANSGTKEVEVPLWGDLDSSIAPNLSDTTDTLATPGKVSTSSWKARNAYLNKGYGAADLAVEIAGTTSDPMTRIRNRFGTYWARQFEYRIIAAARGVLASNVANNAGDMLYNIALETTVGVADANRISSDAVIEAAFTMGDQFGQLRAIALHSIIYKKLVKQDLITFEKTSTQGITIPTYLGMRVIVDDGLPVIAGTTSGFKYLCIIFGAGAIGYGEGSPKVPFELDRIAAGGSGGGLENIWERKTWLIHLAGTNFTSASVAGESPTLAELRLAANHTRVLDRKNVKVAFLQVNA